MQENKFKIGDHVAFINDTGKGIITKINSKIITLKCDDGFEYECFANEIVTTGDLHSYFSNNNHIEFLKENQPETKNNNNLPKKSLRKNKIPPMEVDLHIHQLVSTTKGMSNFDMLNLQLDTAKRKLKFAMSKKIQKVVFIHGIGDGVLMNELHFLLKKYPVEFYEASYKNYGQGATEVFIYQNSKS